MAMFAYLGTHSDTNGDSFDDLFSSLNDNVNGNYMDDDWAKTEKPDYVLATTIWILVRTMSQVTKSDIKVQS